MKMDVGSSIIAKSINDFSTIMKEIEKLNGDYQKDDFTHATKSIINHNNVC
jgi:hypothetical protein